MERGVSRPMKPVPQFTQKKDEKEEEFLNRVDWTTANVLARSRMEDKFKVGNTNNLNENLPPSAWIEHNPLESHVKETFHLNSTWMTLTNQCPPFVEYMDTSEILLELERKGNALFNDALNTFYLRLYGVRHMVKDHSDSERGNLLPPHRLLFPISSKGSFLYASSHR